VIICQCCVNSLLKLPKVPYCGTWVFLFYGTLKKTEFQNKHVYLLDACANLTVYFKVSSLCCPSIRLFGGLVAGGSRPSRLTHSGGSRGVHRPSGGCNPSSVSPVFPGVSSLTVLCDGHSKIWLLLALYREPHVLAALCSAWCITGGVSVIKDLSQCDSQIANATSPAANTVAKQARQMWFFVYI